MKSKQKSQKRQVKFGLQKKDAHENGAMTFLKHCRQEKKQEMDYVSRDDV